LAEERTGLIRSEPAGLMDVLDRVLDKGLVVVGDIRISLVNVELLTLRLRLVLCSIEKAEQVGLDWWRREPSLTGHDGNGNGKLPAAEAAGTVKGK